MIPRYASSSRRKLLVPSPWGPAGGGGVDRDYVEAYKWYSLAVPNAAGALAVDQRFDPVRARRELAARMNRFQIARAEREAGNWRPIP